MTLSFQTLLILFTIVNIVLVVLTIVFCFYLANRLIKDEYDNQLFVTRPDGRVDLVSTPISARIKRVFRPTRNIQREHPQIVRNRDAVDQSPF
uniref:p10 n=1 Tax=Olive leaf yellowing-associated virus TaxID=82791 RepID=A0A7L9K483_9CLOS|nr:p10 [Olive leaf yellowing-associated virus]